MKEIQLVNGMSALVDDEDYDRIIGLGMRWYKTHGGGYKTTYAIGYKPGIYLLMHRFIMNAPDNLTIDHINHNGLDNRRCNLRLATTTEQMANIRVSSRNKCGYKGVHWDSERKSWRALISIHRKRKYLGRFDDPREAARAYNEAAKKYFGEFALLNDL